MAIEYFIKAVGNGDLSASPIFQRAFDWLFSKLAEGDLVAENDYEGVKSTTYTLHMTPPFELTKYGILHELLSSKSVLLTEPMTPDYGDDRLQQTPYLFMEALADQIAHFTAMWIKDLKELDRAEAEALRQFSTMINTGILNDMFHLPLVGGVFEDEFARRCESSAMQDVYQRCYGTRKAMERFPKSPMRGKWLESDLGM
jgi:hypothetical protein